jgi:hypothetical protein
MLFLPLATKAIAGLDKLDQAGNTLLTIAQKIGFWVVTIVCLYNLIQCATKGDKHQIGNIVITYTLLYAAMFFVPWILHFVEGIF